MHKISTDELSEAYQKAINETEQGEELAEFISSRWLLKNSELYEFFEQQLSQIDSDFTQLNEIASDRADHLIKNAIQQFGAPQTYLFSVLNSVVFPKESFQALKVQAAQEQKTGEDQKRVLSEQLSIEEMRKEFSLEIARLTDKYEKKLAGLQKKYVTDVENLKKQLSQLQRKMHHEKKD